MSLMIRGKYNFLTKFGKYITRRYSQEQGYVVLIPEIGEDEPEKNPLYQYDKLPEFNSITIENCRAAVAKQALDFEICVKNIETDLTENECTDVFKQVIVPLEETGVPLDTTWGLSKTLYVGNNTLMPTSSYMAIHERAHRAAASKYHSEPIFKAVKSEINAKQPRTSEEYRILNKFYVEGKLNGLELDEGRQRIIKLQLKKIHEETARYKAKVSIATKQFSHVISDPNLIKDFPEHVLRQISADSNNPHRGPWRLSIQPDMYKTLLEYVPDREVRWNMWQAYVTRGSLYNDRELATSIHLEEIRYAKRIIANLVGYESCFEMSMETKMAGSVEVVQEVLEKLNIQAQEARNTELTSLLQFAHDRGFNSETLEQWDVPYWRRKHLKSINNNFDEAKLNEYFELNKVLNGLFGLCENLFNIVIKARNNVTAWHKDVKFYDIFEPQSSAPIAGFYLDPFSRSSDKIRIENAGWMTSIQSRSEITQTRALAALIFNFNAPQGDIPSLLTFNEVKILFNKFGHSLQHLLTRTKYSGVAGLSNVEWDAVAISSNLLLHWLYNPQVLTNISQHYDNGEPLPQNLLEGLIMAKNHLAGHDLCEELFLSALDMELYHSKDFWLDIIKQIWPVYQSCFKVDKTYSLPCCFSQIVTEEWGAAYYSHLWSRMLAADVYSAFHEVLGDETRVKDVGRRYRDTFLALGGAEHPSQIFREFRGRDPSHKALFKSLGLKNNVET